MGHLARQRQAQSRGDLNLKSAVDGWTREMDALLPRHHFRYLRCVSANSLDCSHHFDDFEHLSVTLDLTDLS